MASIQIYIPCLDSHLEPALLQANKIRHIWKNFIESNPGNSLSISLGLHGNKIDQSISLDSFDEIHNLDLNLGWDMNMNRGFIYALEKDPDFFWLLSVNDIIEDTAFKTIFNSFNEFPNSHLLVSKQDAKNEYLEIFNVDSVIDKLSLGLISSVVYNFKYTKFAIPSSFYFGWTGWGHLSIIFKLLDGDKVLRVVANDPSLLYLKDYGSETKNFDRFRNTLNIVEKYQHSYYGLFLLRFIQIESLAQKKVFVYRWIFKNFKFHNLYRTAEWHTVGSKEQVESINWRKDQVFYLIKGVSFLAWTIYLIISLIPIRKIIIVRSNIDLKRV
jgi:hypothetical protein